MNGTSEQTSLPPMQGRIIPSSMGPLLLGPVLGQGASGVVYEATTIRPNPHTRSHSCFAVKCMRQLTMQTTTSDPTLYQHTAETILHHAVSSHPNVVDILCLAADTRAQLVFIVLELCTGGSLHDRICRGEFCATNSGADERIRSVFGQLVDAVEYCHEKKVYHRDLKPGNVLVQGEAKDARVLLTDFGMATCDEEETGFRYGTRQFWSPECQGDMDPKPYSLRANDVWSLGIVLVLMVTGRFPWSVASPSDKHFQLYQKFPETIGLALGMSQEAWNLVQRILCIDADERISVKALKEELQKIETFSAPAEVPTMQVPAGVEALLASQDESRLGGDGSTFTTVPSREFSQVLDTSLSWDSQDSGACPRFMDSKKPVLNLGRSEQTPSTEEALPGSPRRFGRGRRLLNLPRLLKLKGLRVLGIAKPTPPPMVRTKLVVAGRNPQPVPPPMIRTRLGHRRVVRRSVLPSSTYAYL